MREDRVPAALSYRRPPPDPPPRATNVLAWCGIIVTMGVVAFVAVLGWQSLGPTPAALTAALPPIPAEIRLDEQALARAIAAGIGTPPPLRGEIVMLVPTPSPTPYAPPRPTSSVPAVMTCPDNPNVLPNGELCQGPAAPMPTATPYPTCTRPPVPLLTCQVRHAAASPPSSPETLPTRAAATPIAPREK